MQIVNVKYDVGTINTQKDFEEVYAPLKNVVPMAHPSDLAIGGWECSSTSLADAMRRAQVFDPELQRQICPHWRILHLSQPSSTQSSGCYTIVSLLEGCSYINGSQQNTLVHGIVDLAEMHNVFIAGDPRNWVLSGRRSTHDSWSSSLPLPHAAEVETLQLFRWAL